MKTDHDREDLIELPHFINFPSDQGLIADEEETLPASIEAFEDSEKAEASTTLAQAALEQIEVHGVQSGVSLTLQFTMYSISKTLSLYFDTLIHQYILA
jgi:hypothetical protein